MPVDLPPDEVAAFRRGEAPAPMLDLLGLMACHAVGAARSLGVFDALAAGPLTPRELAAAAGADPAALEHLLGVLRTTGYVRRDDGRYANTPASTAWLCSDSPTDYGRILGLWQAIVEERWAGLAGAVRSGTPAGGFYDWLAGRPHLSAAFHDLQRGLAEWLAEEVVSLAPLPEGSTSLLDLGGAHGLYAGAFCRAHPGLTATVVDAAVAERSEGPLTWRVGDLLTCDLPGGQDVTVLFNVLHGFAATDAAALVAKAAATLRPGGLLVVMESVAEPGSGAADRAFGAAFALNLWHTQGGALHSAETIRGWLEEAGCATGPWQVLTRSPSHALVTATAPSPAPLPERSAAGR
ncbi:methyltransferase [Nonomuraea sp. MCN248]|uniref:Methyltransferase n=1 Tax=Nonomuraea corallina TaxID=2989783 RepID=A0ABT4SB76_9ACTN|nr:methyltransferase [Nonomuraea corallina]MDA0634429.1 methyltransferase [Nonomuraea corallina]